MIAPKPIFPPRLENIVKRAEGAKRVLFHKPDMLALLADRAYQIAARDDLNAEVRRLKAVEAAVHEVLSEGCEGPCSHGPCGQCDCENEGCDINGDEDKFCVRCLIEKRMREAARETHDQRTA